MGPHLPRILFEIGINKKGCGRVYNKIINYSTGIIKEVKEKWERVLNETFSYNIIEIAFKKISNIKSEVYNKYFQYKLLHNRTTKNEKLFKMKISDTEICSMCQEKQDTIKHAFLECQTTVNLWTQVEQWIRTITSKSVKITYIEKIFGYQTNDEVIDKIILAAKIVIHKNRMSNKPHNLFHIKRMIFNELVTEEYAANIHQTENSFTQIWGNIYEILKRTFLR